MLAAHLGVAKETVSRWETGGQIQQRGYDLLLRLYFANTWNQEFLANRAGACPELRVPKVDPANQIIGV
jgi:hypothetical protein